MITMLQLEYFLAINEARNISKAAQKLMVAQQTLSRSLNSVEKELGASLFERGTPLTLTQSGELFLKYAQEAVEKRSTLSDSINDITGNICGTIRFGISYNRSPVLLPDTIAEFQLRYPKVEFYIFEGNHQEIKQAMLNRQIDLAVEHLPFNSADISEEPIMRDNLYLIIPSVLLAQRYGENAPEALKTLERGDDIRPLTDFPFLLNKKGNSIRAAMETIFDKELLRHTVAMETENMETLFRMSMLGRGVTVYPGSFISAGKLAPYEGRFNIIKMAYPQAQYTLGIAARRGHYQTKANRCFMELLKRHAWEQSKRLDARVDSPVRIEGIAEDFDSRL